MHARTDSAHRTNLVFALSHYNKISREYGALLHPIGVNVKPASSARAAFLYPIAGVVKSASSAHAAGSHFVRKRVLSHNVHTARAFFPRYPL